MFHERGFAAAQDAAARVASAVRPAVDEARERAGTALDGRIAETCGALNRIYGELVDEVAEALRHRLWAVDGIRSPEHWVQWRTGLAAAHARELVRVARRADGLPTCTAALRDGALSIDQLATVARCVPDSYDADVVDVARSATVSQLNRVLSRMAFVDRSASATEPEVGGGSAESPPPEVRTTTDREGRFELRASGPADEGEVVCQAIAEARDALFHAGRTDVTDWDALVEVAHRSLDTVRRRGRRDRFRVYVHLDVEGGWLTSGPRLPDHLLDHLTCAGVLRPVWEAEGRPVALGRTTRVIPGDLRRLVLDRDRGCRHPGCENRRFLDLHHVVHWRDGGHTSPDNLIALCGRHHRAHHEGELAISGQADRRDGLEFRNRHGVRITGPSPQPGRRPPPGATYPGPTGERFDARDWALPERAPARQRPPPAA